MYLYYLLCIYVSVFVMTIVIMMMKVKARVLFFLFCVKRCGVFLLCLSSLPSDAAPLCCSPAAQETCIKLKPMARPRVHGHGTPICPSVTSLAASLIINLIAMGCAGCLLEALHHLLEM